MIAVLASAAAPLGGGAGLEVSLVRIISALLLCLVLAAAFALLLKRGGGALNLRALVRAPAARRIELVESRRISAHADICLMRCDGRDYLILSSQASQQVLHQEPAA